MPACPSSAKNASPSSLRMHSAFLSASWKPERRNDMTTCFFYAPHKSSAAELWLAEVYKAFEEGPANYIYSAYRNGIQFRNDIFTPYPHISDYLTITVAWDVVVHRKLARHTKVLMVWNGECFDKLLLEVKQNLREFKKRFLEELNHPKYQITKLRRYQRDYIWPEYKVTIFPDKHTKQLITGVILPTKCWRASQYWLIMNGIEVAIVFISWVSITVAT